MATTLPVQSEAMHLDDVLKYEAPSDYSRETVTVDESQTIVLGQVLKPGTAGRKVVLANGVNEVQRVDFGAAATAGNMTLRVSKPDGDEVETGNIAWSATDATLLGNINTALDAATGVAGGIVATAIPATDTDLGFILTYSGTGYAGKNWPLAVVETKFTSVTTVEVSQTTAGVEDGGDADSIALEAITTGAGETTKKIVAAVRHCIVQADNLAYGNGTKSVADAALLAKGILVREGF